MRLFFRSKKFTEALTTAVFTTVHVMKENSLITLVSHELDGDWQFMGAEPIEDYTKIAMIVSLGQMIKHDKSVLKVADLPMGYRATRNSKSDKWVIERIEYSDAEMKEFGFYCSKCGVYHKEIPMAYGSDAPIRYFLIPEEQREKRSTLTGDQCIIDDEYYYVRGRVELEVEDNEEKFAWNVWVEVSKEDFDRMAEQWEEENRFLEPPYNGKLSSALEPYSQTEGLFVRVITQKVGLTPKIELLESDHPLYFEQESGINMSRVIDFAKKIFYDH